MSDMRYFGKYFRFETESKDQGMLLLNADNLIGDIFTISFEVVEGKTTAWLVNKFDKKVGYFSRSSTYELDVLRAREWNLHALLSEVLYTDTDESGEYWGEVAIVANPERYEEEVLTYLKKVGETLTKGVRPVIDLTEIQIDAMLAQKGEWSSPDNLPMREKSKGTASVKATRSLSESIIEEGRAGNPGCYVVSYLFIGVVVVSVGALIAHLFGVF